MYGKVIYIKDFPNRFLHHDAHFSTMKDGVVPGTIGGSPELAFVPIIFDQKGILLTTKRFLELSLEEQDAMNHYVTDLQTFKKISNWSEAQTDYTQVFVNLHGNPFWIFDPYLIEQHTGNSNR